MRIGVPKETKTLEGRVALVPACTAILPAMIDIGASSGRSPLGSSTVSNATPVSPMSSRWRVSAGSAARCR